MAAAILAGLAAAGVAAKAPAAPRSRGDAVEATAAKALARPQLYQITITRNGQPGPGAMACMDAAVVEQLASVAPAAAGRQAQVRSGCVTAATHRRDGSFRVERSCETAKGAPWDLHGVVEGTARAMRNRTEVAVDLPPGPPRKLVVEDEIRRVGPCPAGLAVGQMRLADGRVAAVTDLVAEALRPIPGALQ